MRIGILWDLDGTLLDTLEDLADGVNYALGQFGYPERTLEEVRRFVGNGAKKLIDRAVPAGADPAPVFDCFQTYYAAHCRIKTRPYGGILQELEKYQALDATYSTSDMVGKTGIEETMESYLRGVNGKETIYVDNMGKVIETSNRIEPLAGNDLYLTIDHDLQVATYDILEQQADAVTIEKSKKMLGQMESVLGADSTIESLVDDIVKHYENGRANLLTGKAMIVAYSRTIA